MYTDSNSETNRKDGTKNTTAKWLTIFHNDKTLLPSLIMSFAKRRDAMKYNPHSVCTVNKTADLKWYSPKETPPTHFSVERAHVHTII